MLTPDALARLSPADRTQLFDRLATAHYGKVWRAAFAEDYDVSLRTVDDWRRKGPPRAVLFALDGWVNSPAGADRIMRDWEDLPVQLDAIVRHLGEVAKVLARVSRAGALVGGRTAGVSPPES